MELVGVPEVAAELSVSERRVRQMIARDLLRAHKLGDRWLVEPSSIPRQQRRRRPMSQRIAWALLMFPEDRGASLRPQEKYRLRGKLNELHDAPEPELVLRDWSSSRAERRLFRFEDPPFLHQESRLIPGGVSDSRSNMADSRLFEGYAASQDVKPLAAQYLLLPEEIPHRGNVILHVSKEIPAPLPMLAIAADLAEHGNPRELSRSRALIQEALTQIESG